MTERSRTREAAVVALTVALLATGCVGPLAGDPGGSTPTATDTLHPPTATPIEVHPTYATTTVTVVDDGTGDELGRVEAAIADTGPLRYTGLSETDRLPEDRGMLFVYDEPQGSLTYVMRNMSFPLDIVFAYGNGTIQSIHHVRAPDPGEDGESIQVSGAGQYVLEVNRGWTTERGVEAGDRLEFELPDG